MPTQLSLLAPQVNSVRRIRKDAKKIIESPCIALEELIANAWDAAATEVEIFWPVEGTSFSISDNGHGMTEDEFANTWACVWYDRTQAQTQHIQLPNISDYTRKPFGKNGLGKLAVFCFGSKIEIKTCKNNTEKTFVVEEKFAETPFTYTMEKSNIAEKCGTCINVLASKHININVDTIISHISQRFLLLPYFQIKINGNIISLNNIPTQCIITEKQIDIEKYGLLSIKVIEKDDKDATTRWSGVAWCVRNRFVGEPSWEIFGQSILDGRTVEGKSLSFLVEADWLDATADWTQLDNESNGNQVAAEAVKAFVMNFIHDSTHEKREARSKKVKAEIQRVHSNIPPISKLKVDTFIETVVDKCPNIKDNDLTTLGTILATIEATKSKYSILEKLKTLTVSEWDKLDEIISDWTITMAKEALDEIEYRLKLVQDLRSKVENDATLEVQELQPIMEKCLWVLGPEFESIEFTSNQSMATCFQKYKKVPTQKLSTLRPDFTILKDSSVSFHSRSSYDTEYNEKGIERLVILELKAPRVAIGYDEQAQPRKYVQEFKTKGLIDESTKVTSFVLGKTKQADLDMEPIVQGQHTIRVLLFDVLLKRAESRLFNLHRKISATSTPFLQNPSATLSV